MISSKFAGPGFFPGLLIDQLTSSLSIVIEIDMTAIADRTMIRTTGRCNNLRESVIVWTGVVHVKTAIPVKGDSQVHDRRASRNMPHDSAQDNGERSRGDHSSEITRPNKGSARLN